MPEPDAMAARFEQFGFVVAARVPDRGLTLYRCIRVALILNQGDGHAAAFRAAHGPVRKRHGVPRR